MTRTTVADLNATAVLSQTFAATPGAVGEIRDQVRKALKGNPRLEDALVIVSELTTNSIRHSLSREVGWIAVDVIVFDAPEPAVRIYVVDAGGPTTPHLVPSGERSEGGMGLALVESLSTMWGYLSSSGSGTTWCELGVAA